jgi:hypothetical protein
MLICCYSQDEPGDITWLSYVDDGQVQPSRNDEFGQIKSGNLTMTGRLGVFRINKDKRSQPGSHSGNLADTKVLKVLGLWDTTEYEQTFGVSGITQLWIYTTYGTTKKPAEVHLLDVFYLLVRVIDHKTEVQGLGQYRLSGLLLLATGKKKGQFRRIGMFEVRGNWGTGLLSEFSCKTDILDPRFFKRKRGNGDYTVSIV